MDETHFFKKLDQIRDIPTLPAILFEINRLLQNENTSVSDIRVVIEKDQTMVMKILKLVNSSFFGFPSKISSINNAIILLGYITIRNAVVTLAVVESFSKKNEQGSFEIEELWKHSIAVAVVSRYLGETFSSVLVNDCFIGGLLHDIGKLIQFRFFRELFDAIWKVITEESLSFSQAEDRLNLVGHADIGGHLARKWMLPPCLIDAIEKHHDIPNEFESISPLIIIHTADAVVNSGPGLQDVQMDLCQIHPIAASVMSNQLNRVSEWYPGLQAEIESCWRFFMKDSI
ncbi:MAG: HDOD domain-containing protein [Desulfatirhabdiaceae bacterium]